MNTFHIIRPLEARIGTQEKFRGKCGGQFTRSIRHRYIRLPSKKFTFTLKPTLPSWSWLTFSLSALQHFSSLPTGIFNSQFCFLLYKSVSFLPFPRSPYNPPPSVFTRSLLSSSISAPQTLCRTHTGQSRLPCGESPHWLNKVPGSRRGLDTGRRNKIPALLDSLESGETDTWASAYRMIVAMIKGRT